MSNEIKMPPEVASYFANGRRKIVSVVPNDDFSLTITFDNAEVRVFDMTENLKGNIFAPFKELTNFRQVYIDDCGCIAWDIDPAISSNTAWNNKVDLCPDSCYIYSSPLNQA